MSYCKLGWSKSHTRGNRVYRNTGDKREQRVAQEEELPAEAGLQQVQGQAIKVNTDV